MSNHITPSYEDPDTYEFGPAPAVQIDNQEDVIRRVNTSGGDAPDRTSARLELYSSPPLSRVRVLDITGYYLPTPLSLTQFVHLRVLRMAFVDRDLAPGITEWTTILQRLPELEELDLSFAVGYHFAGVNEPVGIGPTVYERLRNFKLAIELNLSVPLLSRISIPNFNNFELTLFDEAEKSRLGHANKALKEIKRIFRHRARDQQLECRELHFGLTSKTTSLATHPLHLQSNPSILHPETSHSPSFSILIRSDLRLSSSTLYPPHSPALLLDLFNSVDVVSHNHVKSLSFKFLHPATRFTYQLHDLLPVFTTLTFVENLSIHTNTVKSLRRFLDPLFPPFSPPEQVLLPHLQELTVTAVLTHERDSRASMMAVIDHFIAKRGKWPGCCPVKKGRTVVSEEVEPMICAVVEEEVKVGGCFGRLWARLLRALRRCV